MSVHECKLSVHLIYLRVDFCVYIVHKVSGPLPFVPEKCCKIILVRIILHKKARKSNLPNPSIVDIKDIVEQYFIANSDATGHTAARARLVQNHFL